MENLCWNITHKCNSNCKHCFRELHEKDLTLEENIKKLYELIKLGVAKITWSGGEPTGYEGIDELIKIAKEHGIYNKLVTNASNFTDENSYEIVKYIDEITFSIDTVDDELNSQIGRGKNYFSHVKEVVRNLKEKYPKCRLSVNTIIMKPNLNLIEDIYNEIRKFGIKKWKLIQFCCFRGVAAENKEYFEITDDEYVEVLEKYKRIEDNFEIVGHTAKEVEEEHIIVTSSGKIIK
ncbi:MAG: radical SAM protein [Clostridia bacterium]|nr:radical SAM protein [Clostridia bacterium]